MPGIKLLSGEHFSYEFDKEDAKIIDDMIGKFGTQGREDVILKALSVLYTIYTERPSTKAIIAQDEAGKTTIPLC